MVKKNIKTSGIEKQIYDVTGLMISDETGIALTSLSKSSGLPLCDAENSLGALFTEAYEELIAKGVKESTEHLALNGVKNQVRKLTKKATFEPKAKAVGIVGFIIGDSGLWDKVKQMQDTAKRYVDKNGIQAALEANLINGDNQVLDSRKKIFGKENDKYLEPLEKIVNGKVLKVVDKTRTLHLIARLNGNKVYKYGTIQTNDPTLAVAWNKVKFYKPCQGWGIVKEDPEGVNGFKLNSSQAEDTTSIFKAVTEEMDVDKIFMDVVTPEIVSVGGVEKFHEQYKDVYGAIIFVRGQVAWINRDRPSPFGDIKMGLMDGDTGNIVTVSIPQNIAADFGENSEVIAFGRTKRQDLRQDGEDGKTTWIKGEGDVAIQAVGVYAIPELTTPVDLNRPEALNDEKEIEGWVD